MYGGPEMIIEYKLLYLPILPGTLYLIAKIILIAKKIKISHVFDRPNTDLSRVLFQCQDCCICISFFSGFCETLLDLSNG